MSKKTLLEEGTIRRFMKLAEMGPIGESFVSNMFNEEEEPAPEEVEFASTPGEDLDAEPEGEAGFEAEDEMLDVGDDVLDDEMGDPAAEDAGVEGELTLTDEEAEAFLAVADRIRSALDASPEAEDIPAPDMGVEDEGEEELDVELGAGEEELDVDVEDEDDELVQERSSAVNESLINQVVQRVAKRLTKKRK